MINRFASVGKAGHVAQAQNFGAAADSLVVCRFATFALSETVLARLLSAVTGIEYEPEDLMRVGERIFNLERMYNVREGFRKADDDLPVRLREEAVKDGPSRGSTVKFPEMIEEYYEFRGWDDDGIPTEAKLKILDLEDLANDR
jgi:aldehyde:ferredoxin oxidoreductase